MISPRIDSEQPFRLGEWLVEPDQNRISRPGKERQLTARCMDVLVCLTRKAGEVVSRDDFSDEIWASSVVTDDALTRYISELRRALGDDTRKPAYIETIPKRGYRLIAEIQSPAREASQVAGSHRHMILAAALLLMIMTMAVVVFQGMQDDGQLPSPSIAVLPFEIFSNDDDRSLVDGLHHDLLTRLSSIGDLQVISRTSVRQYRDTLQSIPEIASELNVAWILEGAVQQAGNEIQLNAQLIDADSDTHVWARTYQRSISAENLFAIQAEIVEDIAQSMELHLTRAETSRLEEIPTRSTTAYHLYLQAGDYMTREWINQEDLEIAIQLLEQSISDDPRFALAHARLSEAHLRIYWHLMDHSQERIEQARIALEQARQLDYDAPEVQFATGLYHYWVHRDYTRALEYFETVRSVRPNDSDTWLLIGAIQRRLGLWNEALESLEKALEFDPRNISKHWSLLRTHLVVRDYPSANQLLDQVEALFPDSEFIKERRLWARLKQTGNIGSTPDQIMLEWPDFFNNSADRWLLLYLAGEHEYITDNIEDFPGEAVDMQRYYYPRNMLLGLARQALGNHEEAHPLFDSARQSLEELIRQHPDDPRFRSALGRVLALVGEQDRALDHGSKAMSLLPVKMDARRGPTFELEMARILAEVGHFEQALDFIEHLLDLPFDEMTPALLHADPAWKRLRTLDRFKKLADPPGSG